MGTFIHVVMFAAVLAAFITWALAGLAALNVVNLARRGGKLSTYFQLSLWHLSALEVSLGAEARPHLTRYKRAFLCFFAIIGAILVLSFAKPFLETA